MTECHFFWRHLIQSTEYPETHTKNVYVKALTLRMFAWYMKDFPGEQWKRQEHCWFVRCSYVAADYDDAWAWRTWIQADWESANRRAETLAMNPTHLTPNPTVAPWPAVALAATVLHVKIKLYDACRHAEYWLDRDVGKKDGKPHCACAYTRFGKLQVS